MENYEKNTITSKYVKHDVYEKLLTNNQKITD